MGNTGKKSPKLTKIVLGQTSFKAHGTSKLKISDGGSVDYLEVPIKSIGLAEFENTMRKSAPTAPYTLIRVKQNDTEYKELGIRPGSVVRVYDLTDENYQEQLKTYEQEVSWGLILLALDVEFVDENGEEITNDKLKIKALQDSGFSSSHYYQLLEDIRKLTSDREEEADFLSENLSV